MKRLNQYFFYQLGTIIHPLTLAAETMTVSHLAWTYDSARDWLGALLTNEQFPLTISRSAVRELIGTIDSVIPRDSSEFSSIPVDRKLSRIEAMKVKQAATHFESVLSAELPTLDSYVVTKKGIYSTTDLVEHPELAIDTESRSALTQLALNDFKQAGRCLAFELPTAAGLHTMRAVEAVLKSYWSVVKKQTNGTKPTDAIACINDLRVAGESSKLLDILEHARELHRNTILNRESLLTMTDALRLFDIAKSSISAMANRIAQLSSAGAEMALADFSDETAIETKVKESVA